MPKNPIKARCLYIGNTDRITETKRILDFCTVDTELGPMVEPTQLSMNGALTAPGANGVDLVDSGFTRVCEMNADQFYSQFNSGGDQFLKDFSRD